MKRIARPRWTWSLAFDASQQSAQVTSSSSGTMAKLSMAQRLAVLGAFQITVAITYFAVIERSRARDGSFEKDGYNFWDMYGEPKHKRDQNSNAEKNKS